jgi:hypothetical protein
VQRAESGTRIAVSVQHFFGSDTMLGVKNGTEERLADEGAPDAQPSQHLRAPFRQFWRWWSFWTFFPFVQFLPEGIVTAFGGYLVILIWMPLFFWSGLRPMRVWLERPKPVWLFVVLWMVVPFALAAAVSVLLRLVGLYDRAAER